MAMGDGTQLIVNFVYLNLFVKGTSSDYYKTNFKESASTEGPTFFILSHKSRIFLILFFNISSKFNFNKLVNIRISFNIFFY